MLVITDEYITQTVAPTAEPVSRTEAKLHLRVDISTDDSLIDSLIQAAREYVEIYTGRAFVRRTYRADISYFYNEMQLPKKPIVSISHIKYYNTASPSVLTTLATSNYALDRDIVKLAYGGTWPAVYPFNNAVQITYVSGYAPTSSPDVEAENVPAAVKAAMLILIGDMYENREAQIVGTIIQDNKTVMMLLNTYRVYK